MVLFVALIVLSSTALITIEAQTIITSNYSSALTTDNPKFIRPATSSASYHYEAIQVVVATTGTYTFKSISNLDTYGYLYNQSFDPSYPSENLIIEDDEMGKLHQFQMTATLEAGVSYVLVVSTFNSNVVGPYSVVATGPDNVYYSSLTSMETTTTTSTTMQPSIITSNYSGALNMNSQTYTRYGSSGSFYYQAIEVRVPTTGNYTFRSSSTIADTIGYIYQGNFYPSYPQYNIVAQDDNGAGGGQFLITATLRSDMTYILVFTSFSPVNTGTFDVTASGPGYVSLNPIYINTA